MSNNFDVGYKNGFAHGEASRDAEIYELKQTCIDHVEIQQALRQQLALAHAKIDMLNSPVVLSDWQKLERQLADSQKQVTMLRDAVKFWMQAEGNYDLMKSDKKFQEALAATEPKP